MALQVAFLWHMHQPYYVNPLRGIAVMPWVRLHAVKGYLDMAWLIEKFPRFRCVFNLTPVLLQQIRELAQGAARDAWYEVSAIPAADLNSEQRLLILEHFFKAHWENMIRPYPRYWTLLHKRGLKYDAQSLENAASEFSVADLRDLQVWFNLAWCGYAAEHMFPAIAELKRKGQGFSEHDKQVVLEIHRKILQQVLDQYRALAERGQIELSTSPFYHPILPLVYNTDFARRCMPGRPLPQTYSWPEDVRAQLAAACNLHAEVFGQRPHGLWPSEGAVCPELVPILQELGLEWFATDEEILWRSLMVMHRREQLDRNLLFRGYRVQYGNASANIAFRERSLSDFIGFTASRNDPVRATDFIVGHLEGIARANPEGALCAIILDGENAWEHFPDGAQRFLSELYGRISQHPMLQTTTLHDYFTAYPPQTSITTLHTGSWINADFDIWIGEPEENRAWELLGQTRAYLQRRIEQQDITAEQRQRAFAEILAAEGSDWFWWYGHDFPTDNDVLFDELFRTHLQNVYRICGAAVPDALNAQICRSEAAPAGQQPTDLIHPVVDGQATSYYEWLGAGRYDTDRVSATMYQASRVVRTVFFGADLEQAYFRLDFSVPRIRLADIGLRISIVKPVTRSIALRSLLAVVPECTIEEVDSDGQLTVRGKIDSVRFASVLELAVPFGLLGWKPRDRIEFFVQVHDAHLQLERHPSIGYLALTVPDEQFVIENWQV